VSVSEGWAVCLVGDQIDVDDLRDMLIPPFDPWIESLIEDGVTKPTLVSRPQMSRS